MAENTIVGLDVGSTQIRGVEVTMKGNKPFIKSVASVKLPAGVIEFGEIQNKDVFSKALSKLWKNGRFSAKTVNVSLNSEHNEAKLSIYPDDKDFEKILRLRATKQEDLPQEITEYYISSHTIRKFNKEVIDTSLAEGSRIEPHREILFVAALKKSIDNLVLCLNEAGLRANSIDVAQLALIRAEQSYEEDSPGIDIHVNIGGDTTIIVISHNNQPVYVRSIASAAGNSITDHLMKQMGLADRNRAEELKMKVVDMRPQKPRQQASNIFVDEDEVAVNSAEEVRYSQDEIDAYTYVYEGIASIVTNIKRTINFFITQNTMGLGDQINRIVLSGGTANFAQIRLRLARELGIEAVEISKPISSRIERGEADKNIGADFLAKEFEYAVAVGSAIGTGVAKNA